jgi:Autographiviridae endonuclease VII
MKTCTKCRQLKPLTGFGKSREYRDGLCYWCKTCMCASARASEKAHPERAKRNRHSRVYQISLEERHDLWKKQGERCAICQLPIAEWGKGTHVDHCHATHIVRGLLCSRCNLGVGYLRDSSQICLNAASYLKAAMDVVRGMDPLGYYQNT